MEIPVEEDDVSLLDSQGTETEEIVISQTNGQRSQLEKDTEELQKFRTNWKSELKQPTMPSPAPSSVLSPTASIPTPAPVAPRLKPTTALTASASDSASDDERSSEDESGDILVQLLRDVHVSQPLKVVINEHAHISCVPMEIMVKVLRHLTPEELETTAQVCRQWYSLAREPSLWRELCYRTWKGVDRRTVKGFGRNWRRMYLERPRLRLDGLYISKNSYLRSGATEGIFYQPVWKVTYYRYIRFYREGQVIYYVGPEEPREVASFFRLDRKSHKSVCTGIYQLSEDGRVQAWASAAEGTGTRRLIYHLDMRIESSIVGKNNRLAVDSYNTSYEGSTQLNPCDSDMGRFFFAKLPNTML